MRERAKHARRARRRRGGTFVIIVLVASVVLLGIGGALVDATKAAAQQSGFRERQDRANEALAGAAEWARTELASWTAEKTSAHATLRFAKATVTVELSRKADGTALANAVAASPPDGAAQARIGLVERDGRWVVSRYEIVPVARPAGSTPRKSGTWR